MKKATSMIGLFRGKLTSNAVNDKLKQNIWIGWVITFDDGSQQRLQTGEFKTFKALKEALAGGKAYA
ncbi:hypothetical protein COPG_00019 [Colwellia phage 9A]|uniref:Uncharacterized protein n=1 Tax=Colwellia phage 9A TaxID=765765 RepID=I3UMA0_9CAUD|nr:hypothetical protein COPG_00019 [Colwellia phage 9A]AFK66615.1 hypothetical protein COPG_00019 [Colwellia phage 9A]